MVISVGYLEERRPKIIGIHFAIAVLAIAAIPEELGAFGSPVTAINW